MSNAATSSTESDCNPIAKIHQRLRGFSAKERQEWCRQQTLEHLKFNKEAEPLSLLSYPGWYNTGCCTPNWPVIQDEFNRTGKVEVKIKVLIRRGDGKTKKIDMFGKSISLEDCHLRANTFVDGKLITGPSNNNALPDHVDPPEGLDLLSLLLEQYELVESELENRGAAVKRVGMSLYRKSFEDPACLGDGERQIVEAFQSYQNECREVEKALSELVPPIVAEAESLGINSIVLLKFQTPEKCKAAMVGAARDVIERVKVRRSLQPAAMPAMTPARSDAADAEALPDWPPVQLGGDHTKSVRVLSVDGVWIEKPPLNEARFIAVNALIAAGPPGHTKDGLTADGRGGALRSIKGLARKDDDWGAVIHLPGQARDGYRLVMPASD